MASDRRTFRQRFSAAEVIAEVQNDSDSGDSDLYSDSETESEDSQSFTPLLPVVLDALTQNNDIENESRHSSSSESEMQDESDTDYSPSAQPKRARINNNMPRGQGRGRARGRGQSTPITPSRGRGTRGRGARGRGTRGRGRGRGTGALVQQTVISAWTDAGIQTPNDIPFSGNPGITQDSTNFEPTDYFELFFDDDIINHLCIQTNLYAKQFQDLNNLKQHSRVHCWTDITNDDMKQFLAIVLLMGIVHLPSIEMYWTTKILFNVPVFNLLMTRNTFQLILKFLHFHDNSNLPARDDPNYDRLYKIRPVIDHLFEKFQSVYEPRRSICVDESLLLWKGRLLFRQYIPLKRAQFGIKVYLCCESDGGMKGSGGYCYRFKVYAGKDDPVNEIRPVIPDDAHHLSISEQMVVFLIAPLLDKGYHVYTDNWYTSLRLYLYLREKQTLACGTIRSNRGIPTQLTDQEVGRTGDSCALLGDDKIVATKYHSTKIVYLLSTIHGHSELTVHNRRQNGTIKRPKVTAQYNNNMGGVNKQDQLIQPYDCTRKSMKWTKNYSFILCKSVLAMHLF